MNNMKGYRNVQVMTADRVRLVIMLYEGAIRFNRRAKDAIEKGNSDARASSINRSIEIISELLGALNFEEGGEIARNLQALYQFSIEQLMLANAKNDARPIEAVNRVMAELKAGWDHIASQASGAHEGAVRDGVKAAYGG